MSGKSTIEIRDRIVELRRVRAGDLRANPKNWRRHPEQQQKAMRAVLQEIGFADAVLAREDETHALIIIDGHMRSEMAADELIPVLVLDVTEAEADKILATLDPLAGMAELDSDAWAQLMIGIEPHTTEFRNLLSELNPETVKAGYTDEDSVPEAPTTPVTKRGDVWCMDPHRLLCGDATLERDVQRVLNGVKPPLMVTDPPYGVGLKPDWRNKAFGEANRSVGVVQNDDRADWREAWKLFPGLIAYVWHAGQKAPIVAESLEACGFEIRSQIIWRKPHFVVSRANYHPQHEPLWFCVRRGSSSRWRGGRKQSTVWDIANGLSQGGPREAENALTGHGCQKPVECMRRPILNHTAPGEAVYDPFVGVGGTILAAETTNRIAYVLDIDEKYVDIAVQRWQAFTGQKARLEETQQTFEDVALLRKGGRVDDEER